jgi:hypothetical protein
MLENILHFAYNVPVSVSLVDPQGEYDDGLRQGKFQTTAGQTFTLPRPAVELLYGLDPRPEEEITITKHWKGKPRDPITWTVELSTRSEQFRAAEEITAVLDADEASGTAAALQASIDRIKAEKPVKSPPTLIRKPAKKAEPQPRLFDRGTGTDGPAPQPQPIPAAKPIPVRTKYPDMLLHITRTVKWALAEANLQLGDGPTQDLISTVYIDAAKRSGVEYDFTDARPE